MSFMGNYLDNSRKNFPKQKEWNNANLDDDIISLQPWRFQR